MVEHVDKDNKDDGKAETAAPVPLDAVLDLVLGNHLGRRGGREQERSTQGPVEEREHQTREPAAAQRVLVLEGRLGLHSVQEVEAPCDHETQHGLAVLVRCAKLALRGLVQEVHAGSQPSSDP